MDRAAGQAMGLVCAIENFYLLVFICVPYALQMTPIEPLALGRNVALQMAFVKFQWRHRHQPQHQGDLFALALALALASIWKPEGFV